MSNIPETKVSEKIYAFDSLYTTNHIQMLKVLLPCLNPSLQRTLTLYIKFLELFYAINFLNAHPYAIKGCVFDHSSFDLDTFTKDIEPYMSSSEAKTFQQIRQSVQTAKQFEKMQQKMETLKDILPEGFDIGNLSSFGNMFSNMDSSFINKNPSTSTMMENLFSEKQKDLYEKFNERFKNI